MSRQIMAGRYWPADTVWHRRDPLAKLLVAFGLIIPVVLARLPGALALAAALLGLLWLTARLPARLLLGTLRAFSWLIVLTLLANLLFASGADAGPAWPPRPTAASAAAAGLNALRLILLFGVGAWLNGTTSPLALTNGIARAVSPLGRIGLPTGDLVFVMGLGLRLIPELFEVGGRVHLAQLARGVGAGRKWRARRKGAEALALALFAFAFRRADELALAMEARGYRPVRRVRPYGRPMGAPDYLALAAGLAAAVVLSWLGRRA